MTSPDIAPDHVKVKRAYDPADASDGMRILVDRLWPRGVSKARADLADWMKDIAPSTELRQWYHKDMADWPGFEARYRAELAGHPALVEQLRTLARRQVVTLIHSSRGETQNNATVLRDVVLGQT